MSWHVKCFNFLSNMFYILKFSRITAIIIFYLCRNKSVGIAHEVKNLSYISTLTICVSKLRNLNQLIIYAILNRCLFDQSDREDEVEIS